MHNRTVYSIGSNPSPPVYLAPISQLSHPSMPNMTGLDPSLSHDINTAPIPSPGLLSPPNLWQPSPAGEKDPFDTLAIKRKRLGHLSSPAHGKRPRIDPFKPTSPSAKPHEIADSPGPSTEVSPSFRAPSHAAVAPPPPGFRLSAPPAADHADPNGIKPAEIPIAKDPRLQPLGTH